MHDEFAALHSSTRERLSSLANEWAAGETSASGFAEAMDAILLDAHTEAVVIGRTHAGDDTPREADDERFAAGVVEAEHEFLQAFRGELEAGRYTVDGVRDETAVARRAGQYADRLTGSANEAWSLTLPEDSLIYWDCVEDSSSCEDCPEMEAASPWRVSEMPLHVGMNLTACMSSCRCIERLESGQTGFVTP